MWRRLRYVVFLLTTAPGLFLGYNSIRAWYRSMSGIDMPYGITGFAISPDGRAVVFSTSDGRLYSLDSHTRRSIRLLKLPDVFPQDPVKGMGSDQQDPAYSRDGRYLAYSAAESARNPVHHIFIADLRNPGKSTQLTSSGCDDSSPSFSEDGRTLVFIRTIPYNSSSGPLHGSLFSVDIRTLTETRLTPRVYANLTGPRYICHDELVAFFGVETKPDSSIQISYSSLHQIVCRSHPSGDGIPDEIDLGRINNNPNDAVTSQDGSEYILAGGSSGSSPWGLWDWNRKTGNLSRIESVPGGLVCHRPTLDDSRTVYFLAETGCDPYGSVLNSLWMCRVGDSKPAREVISLDDIADSH